MERYIRCPEHDKRFARGDDYAADAWRDRLTGEIRICIVGCDMNRRAVCREAVDSACWTITPAGIAALAKASIDYLAKADRLKKIERGE